MKKRSIKKLSIRRQTLTHLSDNVQARIEGGAISTALCPTPATMCFICPPITQNRTCQCTGSQYVCCE
jgi:hypothetical protein